MEGKDAFYQDNNGLTTSFHCKNGELKIITDMLLQRAPKLNKLKRGPAGTIDISDYEVEAVKIFLNVLMGFESLSQGKMSIIFPIAHACELDDFMQKCVAELKISYDANLVRLLNMATKYDSEDLVDEIINFLGSSGIESLFSNQRLLLLLEPKSVVALLKLRVKSAEILSNIITWGSTYIRNNNLDCDLRTFLSENHILRKLSLDWFHSIDSVLKFHNSDWLQSTRVVRKVKTKVE